MIFVCHLANICGPLLQRAGIFQRSLFLSVSLHTYSVQVSGELRTFSLATQISERIEKAIEYNVVTDCFNVAETSIIVEVFIG